VNFLLTKRQEIFFSAVLRVETRVAWQNVHALSYVASLVSPRAVRRIVAAHNTRQHVAAAALTYDVHRFEQSIGGRDYLIEVAAVTKDRWRACIVRVPGVPTALMPFYGSTPAEAAEHLSAWLTRAHQRAATQTTPV